MFKAEEIFQNITDKNHPDETVLTIIQGKGTLPREQAGRNIHYDDASLSNYKKVEQGDFIIHLRSFEGGLEMANEAGIVSPAYTILRCKRPHSSLFYDAYFHTDEFINHNLSKSVEGIRDGRQISYEAFKWLGIPYCEPTEQEKISNLFAALNERIAKQRDLVESLKKYKRGLLHDVLSEKIKITTEAWTEHRIGEFLHAGRLDKTGGLTVKTIRDVILVLRLSMEFAYKERAIPLLNWDLIEYPKELGIKKVVSLSKDQEQALIQCIYMNLNRKTAGILIALFTGVRIGELCGLQMKDISLTDKTISINKTVQRIYDKKKGESYLHIGPPKTKTSARTIPVPSLLMNIIKKFYTDNPNHYFLTGKTKPTEPRTYRQFFTRFLKRNGLEKVKFHEIRHTFAVRAIEIPEFDIKSLSEILGHKNVSFTLNVYGSANLQQKVKCMNLLNDLL